MTTCFALIMLANANGYCLLTATAVNLTTGVITFTHGDVNDTLGVNRSVNDEEIRRSYKRHREIYASGGLATSSLLTVSRYFCR